MVDPPSTCNPTIRHFILTRTPRNRFGEPVQISDPYRYPRTGFPNQYIRLSGVTVQELRLDYHNKETPLFTRYAYCGKLNKFLDSNLVRLHGLRSSHLAPRRYLPVPETVSLNPQAATFNPDS